MGDITIPAQGTVDGDVIQLATEVKAMSLVDLDGLGMGYLLKVPFAAAGPGAADDVVIYSANAPFDMAIADSWVFVSTAIGTETLTVRDAVAGAGNALSDAFDCGTTGKKGNTSLQATGTVAAGGTLALRRSDNGLAGEAWLLIQRLA